MEELLSPAIIQRSIWSFAFHFIFLLFTIKFLWFPADAAFSNETDQLALLHFKSQITEDPLHSLSSWNDTFHFCLWEGVICSRRHPQRVVSLNLTDRKLVGLISPYVANLTFLRIIDLSHNNFYGTVPQEVGHLFRLQQLLLANNTLVGEIPTNLSYCSTLKHIDLIGNQLGGKIPVEISSLSMLTSLKFSRNNLKGSIPPSLGNLSSLAHLHLAKNILKGSIPNELGQLLHLETLAVGSNKLSGGIPPPLFNLSSLIVLGVELNNLHGNLPLDLGLALPNLQRLTCGGNQFTGPIPVSLPNASRLTIIDLAFNNFTGSVPKNFGNLQGLYELNLAVNQLGSRKGHGLSFLESLTNCSYLQDLELGENQLHGALPASVANLSTQLQRLSFSFNMIFGSIPSEIGNLIGLTELDLGKNHLTGTIPNSIGKLNELEELYLLENELTGNIPSSLCNITKMGTLSLPENQLSGSIPPCVGSNKWHQFIGLYDNSLSSSLPEQLFNISNLIEIIIENNFFTSRLPSEIGNLKALSSFSVSNNRLSGEIPGSLGDSLSLEYLYLDGNLFRGSIPQTLSALKGLRILDLSRNNLSGKIPDFFQNISALEYLNLSFNDFEGELPKQGIFGNASRISVVGNSKLCGGIQKLGLPVCPTQASKKGRTSADFKVKISIITVVLGLIVLVSFFTTLCWIRKPKKKLPLMTSLKDPFMNVSYSELLKATDGFSSENLIGAGSYGSVYKGILELEQTIVAVKVLHLHQHGALQSFIAESEALRNIRHRNLVKILTCCSSTDFQGNDFKALVFEYMSNGSLEKWLHNDEQDESGRSLNFIQRLNIAIDVSSALDYLHHHSHMPIVHRDLKPSNILLDDDMVAHVGDFGLARFVSNATEIVSSGMKGSIGYMAPEYAMGGKASTEGDVYSYGIILLELITGKRPTNEAFVDGLSLHQFAKSAFFEQVMEIIDPRLLFEEPRIIGGGENHFDLRNKMQDCLISMIKIGVSCSTESPRERLHMRDVNVELHSIKNLFIGVRAHRNELNRPMLLDEGSTYLSNY